MYTNPPNVFLYDRRSLAQYLGVSDAHLRWILYEMKPENFYVSFKIPKGNDQYRVIHAPNKELKAIQRSMAALFTSLYTPKFASFGFVQGKNISLNAMHHTRKRLILNIDLKDFFHQFHFGRVRGVLIKPPYSFSPEVATVMSQLCCFNNTLPQGAPTSPILTNMICRSLDTQLTSISKNNKLMYTRYADDITFSTHRRAFPKNIIQSQDGIINLGETLYSCFKANHLEINTSKIHLATSHSHQEVTGLVVNTKLNLKRVYIKQLRAILHHSKLDGLLSAAKEYIEKGYCKNKRILETYTASEYEDSIISWFKKVLVGKINFIRDVRGASDFLFFKYANQYNKITDQPYFDLSEFYERQNQIQKRVLILVGRTSQRQGTGFILKDVGLITSRHVIDDGDFYDLINSKDGKIKLLTQDDILGEDQNIDYAIFNYQDDNGYSLSSVEQILTGTKVKIIGFPKYFEGDTYTETDCEVVSQSTYMGHSLYVVNLPLRHGYSGGVVLDQDDKVLGLVKAGVENYEDSYNQKSGFILMKDILDHYNL